MSHTYHVYTLWSENDAPLYVGCSVNVDSRLAAHRSDKEWFRDVARVEIDETTYTTRAAGQAAEAERIRLLHPWHNIHHNWDARRLPLGAESKRTAEVLVYLRAANHVCPEGSFAAWLWERRDTCTNWRLLREEWEEQTSGVLPLNARMVMALKSLFGHHTQAYRARIAEQAAA